MSTICRDGAEGGEELGVGVWLCDGGLSGLWV